MDLGLKDKTVFITGAGRGIGFAIAEGFLREGANVILNARNEDSLKNAIKSFPSDLRDRVSVIAADILKKEGSDSVIGFLKEDIGKLDIFVANLGGGKPLSDDSLDESELQRFFELNVTGNVAILHKIHPLLKKSSSASVIFISSIVAREAMNAPCGYGMAKSAVLTFSKYLSQMWADDGIRVNCVLPGNVLFSGGRWDELLKLNKNEIEQYIEQNVPMRRFGRPEEIADAVAFLASERASFVTGASLSVDGGQLRTV